MQGPDNELWYYYMDPNTGIWGGRFSAQITVSAPAMVIRSSGETDIVGSGPNNARTTFGRIRLLLAAFSAPFWEFRS